MITWLKDGGVSVDAPAKPKKITGTRFGAVLGLNPWSTPFKVWCEMTRTYEEPYEDTIYTIAGKKIESKQIDYMRMFYDGVIEPSDIYGKDFFKTTHGDFFPHTIYFGGMWDALIRSDEISGVIECKTTKRAEDWKDDIPEYYALQASLYAHLLGYDDVIMVCSVLEEDDYPRADDFEVNSRNTFVRKFKVSERYPDFTKLIEYATDFYNDYVLTGFSPIPTKNDADILKILHTEFITPDDSTEELISELESLYTEIKEADKQMASINKRYKNISAELKDRITKGAGNGERYELNGDKYIITYTPVASEGIDIERMKADGIYDNYKIVKPQTYKSSIKEKK